MNIIMIMMITIMLVLLVFVALLLSLFVSKALDPKPLAPLLVGLLASSRLCSGAGVSLQKYVLICGLP